MSSAQALTFHRELFRGIKLHASSREAASLNYEVVTAVQPEGGKVVTFRHFPLPGPYTSRRPMQPEIVQMPRAMAARVLDFCIATYVEGEENFNCYSFVGHAVGWQDEVHQPGIHRYRGAPIGAQEDTIANEPYAVFAPDASLDDSPIVHALLGSERPGYSLNVIGPEKPLAFVRNDDLIRLYAARQLIHLTGRELVVDY